MIRKAIVILGMAAFIWSMGWGVKTLINYNAGYTKASAGYDRFKTVGVDTVSHGRTVIVIRDTKTGCLWGQVEVGNSGIDMFRITPEETCRMRTKEGVW